MAVRSEYIKNLMETKNSLEKQFQEVVTESVKNIIGDNAKSEVRRLLKESEDEDSYEEEEVDTVAVDEPESGDVMDGAETDVLGDDDDIWKDLEGCKSADGEYDCRGMEDDKLLKILNAMGDEDGIRVMSNDDGTVQLTVDGDAIDGEKEFTIDLDTLTVSTDGDDDEYEDDEFEDEDGDEFEDDEFEDDDEFDEDEDDDLEVDVVADDEDLQTEAVSPRVQELLDSGEFDLPDAVDLKNPMAKRAAIDDNLKDRGFENLAKGRRRKPFGRGVPSLGMDESRRRMNESYYDDDFDMYDDEDPLADFNLPDDIDDPRAASAARQDIDIDVVPDDEERPEYSDDFDPSQLEDDDEPIDLDVIPDDDDDLKTEGKVNLGYTDSYQKKTAMTTPDNHEPASPKKTRSWDAGAPKGTEKPYAQDGDRTPYTETVNEVMSSSESNPVVRGNGMTHANTNKKGKKFRNSSEGGVKVKGTGENSYSGRSDEGFDFNRKMNSIYEENKQMKSLIPQLHDKLTEAMVVNSSMGYIVRLLNENTTTVDEKKEISDRFSKVTSLEESKKLYETISNELRKANKSNNINGLFNGQLAEGKQNSQQMLVEKTVYRSEKVNEALDFMARLDKIK